MGGGVARGLSAVQKVCGGASQEEAFGAGRPSKRARSMAALVNGEACALWKMEGVGGLTAAGGAGPVRGGAKSERKRKRENADVEERAGGSDSCMRAGGSDSCITEDESSLGEWEDLSHSRTTAVLAQDAKPAAADDDDHVGLSASSLLEASKDDKGKKATLSSLPLSKDAHRLEASSGPSEGGGTSASDSTGGAGKREYAKTVKLEPGSYTLHPRMQRGGGALRLRQVTRPRSRGKDGRDVMPGGLVVVVE